MNKKNYTKELVILWYGTILIVTDRRTAVRTIFQLAIRNLKIHDHAKSKPMNYVFEYWKSVLFFINISVFPSLSLQGDFDALVRRNGTPLQDIMRFEAMRLMSFNGMTIAVSALKLAREGFFATGNGDEARCFSCGIRHRHWEQRDRPEHVCHKEWCGDFFHWNVRFEENRLPTYSEVLTRNQLAFPTDFDIHPRRPDASHRSHRNRALCQNNPAASVANTNNNQDLLSRNRLAESGTSTPQTTECTGAGNRDCVQCPSCGIELRNRDPRRELERHNPSCGYTEALTGQQLHIEIMITIAIQEFDGCHRRFFRPNSQEHELVEMFHRCFKLGFNHQEVERAVH